MELREKREQLLQNLSGYGRVAVAFSAGVDSTVVCKAAAVAIGDKAIAVTAISPSVAMGEVEQAEQLADRIGIRHVVIRTHEFDDPNYTRNPADRCRYCKTELYSQIASRRAELKFDTIVNGANTDDLGDYRPGLRAAKDFKVCSPLVEAGCSKVDVRGLAKFWDLPVWDKPASPCLSSRVAYGTEVTPDRLRRIDMAERFLREHFALRELRVRCEAADAARIEVPPEHIARLTAQHDLVSNHLLGLGFSQVTVDLRGFRSGSMNESLSLVQLELGS